MQKILIDILSAQKSSGVKNIPRIVFTVFSSLQKELDFFSE